MYDFLQIDHIDLMAACLENAIAGAGGFCCGKKYVVDHQVGELFNP